MQKNSPENSLPLHRQNTEKISLSYDVSDHIYSKVKIRLTSYRFRSLIGQILHSVANGSPPLQHLRK